MRILIVEDSRELARLIERALRHAGMDVDMVGHAGDAGLAVQTMKYAAIVLDLGLPDEDGLSVLDMLRRRRDDTPVIVVSSRNALGDRVAGLQRGASDYLVKPFAMDELVARIQALLRRSPHAKARALKIANLSLDTESRMATVGDRTIPVPAREAELLEAFLKRGEQVLAHEVLGSLVFGGTQDASSNAIEVYIHRLRRLLADAGADVHIHTIRGIGYLMKAAAAAPVAVTSGHLPGR